MNLREFIENNTNLIAVMGVFGSISALSISLDNPLLTYSSFGIFLLLSWELSRSFPQEEGDISAIELMRAFYFVFILSIYFYVARYSFITYPYLKLLFIIAFILSPLLKISLLSFDKWEKGNDFSFLLIRIQNHNLNLKLFIYLCPIILPIEFTIIITKGLELIL